MGPHIVFTWELGGGYGHIAGFLPLARELSRRGCVVSWVLRDLSNVERFELPRGNRVFQAPIWLSRKGEYAPVGNYSELLFRQGYLDPEALLGVTRGWQGLFDLLDPGLIICDHSPTALVASHGTPTPRALLGTGFFSPPDASPWPSLRPWESVAPERLAAADRRVHATINEVLAGLRRPPLGRLPDLFQVEENFLCTFPELDHYPGRPGDAYWGPRMELAMGETPRWPSGSGPRIFGYLKREYGITDHLLGALADLGHPTLLHIPGADEGDAPAPHIRITPRPVAMADACREAHSVLCHAGHGTVSAALLAGRPVAAVPTQQEQRILAGALRRHGLGVEVTPAMDRSHCAAALDTLISNPVYANNARAFAHKYRDFEHHEQVELMAERCLELACP